MEGPTAAEVEPPSRRRRILRVLSALAIVVLVPAGAWLFSAAALGDRTTAMVVALSSTCAGCAAFMSRQSRGGAARVVATAAFGAMPVIALATLRALSEPLMGSAFEDVAAREREGLESIIVAVALASVCALLAGFIAKRRLDDRRDARWILGLLTWSPVFVVPAVLAFTLGEGLRAPGPDGYSLAQPVLGHMDPVRADGAVVVDELEREEGITLVRVCEAEPWCYTLLRRGDQVSTRPGFVARTAPVHLRYDRVHELYLVESGGALVATINAKNLASYTRLLPHHVRGSLAPPRAYQALAGVSLCLVALLLASRRRLRARRRDAARGEAGVCFGDGWGLLADGTTLRVPRDMARGSILVLWADGVERTMTVLEGTRDAITRGFEERHRALEAMQLAVLWTLSTPLLISAAIV